MKISARNTFSGRITAISLGPVSAEVTITDRTGD
jgi:molybdopterin-binding protein